MRLLISGGNGYLAERVIANQGQDHQIFATYRSQKSAKQNVEWVHESECPAMLPESIDAVIHLAQSGNYRDFPNSSKDMFAVNVALSHSLLEYARTAGAQCFVYASTGGVYSPSQDPLEEDGSVVSPGDFYAATKLASEILVKPYEQFFNVSILRLFFLYGENQHSRLIPNLIQRVKNEEPVELNHGDGGLKITPTHVDDVAKVIRTAVEKNWSGTYNVASPEVLSIKDIALEIGEVLGKDVRFTVNSGTSAAALVPDLQRLSQQMDMGRFTSFSEGIRSVIGTESLLK